MHFPQSTSTGNYVPFQRQIPGRIFRKPAHPESPSHFGRIRARNHRPIRPPINKEASSRTAGHEVHREFRTQRRPLNVAFVLRRTVEQETLYPAPPSGDRAVPATASCSDRRRHRTARFHLGRIYSDGSYSPSTAFLAAAAMLSRSSLVGWSFAATQLSSSILNRALSGSCSSMAS